MSEQTSNQPITLGELIALHWYDPATGADYTSEGPTRDAVIHAAMTVSAAIAARQSPTPGATND